jgi:hypothetical protein
VIVSYSYTECNTGHIPSLQENAQMPPRFLGTVIFAVCLESRAEGLPQHFLRFLPNPAHTGVISPKDIVQFFHV